LALVAAGGLRRAFARRVPVAPSGRARVWLRGGPIDPTTDTLCRELPRTGYKE